MKILDFDQFITEAYKYSSTGVRDTGGVMWMGDYKFTSDLYDYNMSLIAFYGDESDDMTVKFDIYTTQALLKTVPVQNTFKLIATVTKILEDFLGQLLKKGISVKKIENHYVGVDVDDPKEKNRRAVVFNRAIASALKHMKVKYTQKDTDLGSGKSGKLMTSSEFIFKKPLSSK